MSIVYVVVGVCHNVDEPLSACNVETNVVGVYTDERDAIINMVKAQTKEMLTNTVYVPPAMPDENASLEEWRTYAYINYHSIKPIEYNTNLFHYYVYVSDMKTTHH